MKTKPSSPKINIITLGCSKNLVDSETILGQLKGSGLEATHQSNGKSDIVVVNTCGFIENAKEESVNTILQYAREKKAGRIEKLVVTGCLSERYRPVLQREIPEVDAFFGTHNLPDLLKTLGADYRHELLGDRLLTTPSHFAYLKISEGCNRTCAFCAIPLMRGGHVSKAIEAIVAETKNLVKNGVKEIILIAQELTYYGLDIYKKRKLADLLKYLSDIEGLEWIRLHYAYPNKFPLEVLEVMNERHNICKYLDMPLQHISDPVLSRMKRSITRKETEALVQTVREKVPGIALRTTMLVGFPGETMEDHEQLMSFVESYKFDRLGAFTYSHEEGTSAHQLEDDIPDETKQQRASELMELQSGISFELNREKIGKTFKVLFDRKEGEYFIGRTEGDSPEVDNEVLVGASEQYVRVGDFAHVEITDATEFDLFGKIATP